MGRILRHPSNRGRLDPEHEDDPPNIAPNSTPEPVRRATVSAPNGIYFTSRSEPIDGSPAPSASELTASAVLISWWRNRKARSSSRLRRSQVVTSSLHLLVLHERHAGTMFSSV